MDLPSNITGLLPSTFLDCEIWYLQFFYYLSSPTYNLRSLLILFSGLEGDSSSMCTPFTKAVKRATGIY